MLRRVLHILQILEQLGRATRTDLDPYTRGLLEFLNDRSIDLRFMRRIDRQLLILWDVGENRCILRAAAPAGTERKQYKRAGQEEAGADVPSFVQLYHDFHFHFLII